MLRTLEIGVREMSWLDELCLFFSRIAARLSLSTGEKRNPPCEESARLFQACIQAMEESTDAHLKYVEALNRGEPLQIQSRREMVDQADDALREAVKRLREHQIDHGCRAE